jgi:hypothetical protein
LQTVEETLFANRKSKEKNASSNEPNTPLRVRSGAIAAPGNQLTAPDKHKN